MAQSGTFTAQDLLSREVVDFKSASEYLSDSESYTGLPGTLRIVNSVGVIPLLFTGSFLAVLGETEKGISGGFGVLALIFSLVLFAGICLYGSYNAIRVYKVDLRRFEAYEAMERVLDGSPRSGTTQQMP